MNRQMCSVREFRRTLLCCILILATGALYVGVSAASSSHGTAGVVDFYAATPLGAFEGVFPERFAADDLTSLLRRAGPGQLAVIPRGVMQRAEAAIRWRNEDVLRFDRLETLAHAVGADRLVIGWINTLDIESEGSLGGLGGSPTSADIEVQVFDATQGRIVAETQEESFAIFGTRNYIAGRVLHLALVPVVPWLIARLAPTP